MEIKDAGCDGGNGGERGVIRGVYAYAALWECGGFARLARVHVTLCNSLCTSGH